jgi:hypothetical protein
MRRMPRHLGVMALTVILVLGLVAPISAAEEGDAQPGECETLEVRYERTTSETETSDWVSEPPGEGWEEIDTREHTTKDRVTETQHRFERTTSETSDWRTSSPGDGWERIDSREHVVQEEVVEQETESRFEPRTQGPPDGDGWNQTGETRANGNQIEWSRTIDVVTQERLTETQHRYERTTYETSDWRTSPPGDEWTKIETREHVVEDEVVETQYLYQRHIERTEDSGWTTETPAGDGWAEAERRVVPIEGCEPSGDDDPTTVEFTGQGFRDGELESRECDDIDLGQAAGMLEDPEAGYLMWVLTHAGAETATLDGPWGSVEMVRIGGSTTFHAATRYYELDALLGSASVTVVDGVGNPQLVVSSGCPGDDRPERFDIELVKVWDVVDDPDGHFDEDAASATLTAQPDRGLEHGDTYTVEEDATDTGNPACTVTATHGLGEHTVDADDAVDGTITHTVTNQITCDEVLDQAPPERPEQPERPDMPRQPDEPEGPSTPERPDRSQRPGGPERPGEPEGPGKREGPAETRRPERPVVAPTQVTAPVVAAPPAVAGVREPAVKAAVGDPEVATLATGDLPRTGVAVRWLATLGALALALGGLLLASDRRTRRTGT